MLRTKKCYIVIVPYFLLGPAFYLWRKPAPQVKQPPFGLLGLLLFVVVVVVVAFSYLPVLAGMTESGNIL